MVMSKEIESLVAELTPEVAVAALTAELARRKTITREQACAILEAGIPKAFGDKKWFEIRFDAAAIDDDDAHKIEKFKDGSLEKFEALVKEKFEEKFVARFAAFSEIAPESEQDKSVKPWIRLRKKDDMERGYDYTIGFDESTFSRLQQIANGEINFADRFMAKSAIPSAAAAGQRQFSSSAIT